MDDGDDLIIGVRQLMNDYYAKDIGNKIRHGYREKQKEGLVVKPPFGYWKDRNTGRIRLHPEASVTVQIIYGFTAKVWGKRRLPEGSIPCSEGRPSSFTMNGAARQRGKHTAGHTKA